MGVNVEDRFGVRTDTCGAGELLRFGTMAVSHRHAPPGGARRVEGHQFPVVAGGRRPCVRGPPGAGGQRARPRHASDSARPERASRPPSSSRVGGSARGPSGRRTSQLKEPDVEHARGLECPRPASLNIADLGRKLLYPGPIDLEWVGPPTAVSFRCRPHSGFVRGVRSRPAAPPDRGRLASRPLPQG